MWITFSTKLFLVEFCLPINWLQIHFDCLSKNDAHTEHSDYWEKERNVYEQLLFHVQLTSDFFELSAFNETWDVDVSYAMDPSILNWNANASNDLLTQLHTKDASLFNVSCNMSFKRHFTIKNALMKWWDNIQSMFSHNNSFLLFCFVHSCFRSQLFSCSYTNALAAPLCIRKNGKFTVKFQCSCLSSAYFCPQHCALIMSHRADLPMYINYFECLWAI